MKAAAIILFSLLLPCHADTKRDLDLLTQKRDQAEEQAIQALRSKFIEDARLLLQKAEQSGDVVAQTAIKAELSRFDEAFSEAQPALGPFLGTYWAKGLNGNKFSVAGFRADGLFEELSYKEQNDRLFYQCDYKISKDPKVRLNYHSEGHKFTCEIAGDKMRRSDGTVWSRITKKQYLDALAADGLESALKAVGAGK